LTVGRHKFEISYEASGERPKEDEAVFGTSLMEKAGLVKTKRSKARRKSSDEVDTEDDIALQWMLGKE
jgi:hypothetical protein